jgi:hypothetical protein
MKEFKVGDRVVFINDPSRIGTVVCIDDNPSYPIVVKFDNGQKSTFTTRGFRFLSNNEPCITHASRSLRLKYTYELVKYRIKQLSARQLTIILYAAVFCLAIWNTLEVRRNSSLREQQFKEAQRQTEALKAMRLSADRLYEVWTQTKSDTLNQNFQNAK